MKQELVLKINTKLEINDIISINNVNFIVGKIKYDICRNKHEHYLKEVKVSPTRIKKKLIDILLTIHDYDQLLPIFNKDDEVLINCVMYKVTYRYCGVRFKEFNLVKK